MLFAIVTTPALQNLVDSLPAVQFTCVYVRWKRRPDYSWWPPSPACPSLFRIPSLSSTHIPPVYCFVITRLTVLENSFRRSFLPTLAGPSDCLPESRAPRSSPELPLFPVSLWRN